MSDLVRQIVDKIGGDMHPGGLSALCPGLAIRQVIDQCVSKLDRLKTTDWLFISHPSIPSGHTGLF